MYQRIGKAAYKVDLSNTLQLCKLLNNPEKKFKSVHIAGTNGKGSTSHLLASVLQESGYKVGLYTSPHLKDFRERVKINGEMISEQDIIGFVNEHKTKFEAINLSFFEWTVGLAFSYFAKQEVDIAIIETGLGGRLDSTNVVIPEVSIITNIALDHTQFLGTTLPQIAREKAGIIKNNIPVIVGETQPQISSIFIESCKKNNTSIRFADQLNIETFQTDLKGGYQKKNVKTCIAALHVLQNNGWNISSEQIKKGLMNVVPNTNLLGRWQTIDNNPSIIADTGHNTAGIKEIVAQLSKTPYNQLHFVFGTVNDKSVESILALLPKDATYYLCEADIPRALPINELFELAKDYNLKSLKYNSVKQAFDSAKENAKKDDLIFVGGSTFVVAEIV